jgi:hypothetical protein
MNAARRQARATLGRGAHVVVGGGRRVLSRGADRVPVVRRGLAAVHRELGRALGLDGTDATYGGRYFGEDRDPLDRMGLSGYERYDRSTSNADVAAYALWRCFAPHESLDVGCAQGFVVEALRELGVHAHGVDVSPWAIEHAAPGAHGHVRTADLLVGLPFKRHRFDLVSALEVLEHLPPEAIPRAVRELARVTSGHVVATIPSFGPNPSGPDGWLEVKVREEVTDAYYALGPDYDGPVPRADLNVDTQGRPLEGHLTIASFRWWTERFAEAGLVRCPAIERQLHPILCRLGMTKYWNLYVLAAPGARREPAAFRSKTDLAQVEHRWGLTDRRAPADDLTRVAAALGLSEEAVVRAGLP